MQLHYNVYGAGQTPLVILHGFMGTADNWHTLAQKFSAHRQVVTIDLRNHGRSPHNKEFSIPHMADDVLQVMQELNIPNCLLLGHSMGGKIAMHLALNHPEQVSKLLVADIAPRAYHRGHDDVFDALFAVDLHNLKTRKEAEEAMLPFVPDFGVRQFLLKNLARNEDGSFYWKMNLSVLHTKYEEIIVQIDHPLTYTKPALFIRGGNSNYIRDKDIDDIHRLFPVAELITIPQAGHWLHAEQPALFFEAVTAFISK